MTASTLVIAFSPDFSEDDVRVHVELCRSYSPELVVSTRILNSIADAAALFDAFGHVDALVVWNLYMEVDDVSLALRRLFGTKLVGSNHTVTVNTVCKSAMYPVLHRDGIATPAWGAVADSDGIEALLGTALEYPVIVKVDRGYDSLGLSASSVCHDADSLATRALETIRDHGPIVVQKFVAGREFTVAVANNRAFKPVERIFPPGSVVFLPRAACSKRYCDEPELEAALRALASRTARAFAIGKTEYCRVDIRQDPATGNLYPIDVNDMCSVWPGGHFDMSLAGDGVALSELIGWLTAPARYRAARSRIAIYVVWHSNLSQIESVLPFIEAFDCEIFLYAWNDSYDAMKTYFTDRLGVQAFRFDIDTFLERLEREDRSVVVMFTESLNYPFGAWSKKVFEAVRAEWPKVIDVVCIGHCLDHSSCSSCLSDVGDVPLKMTAYRSGRLPYDAEEVRTRYPISDQTVLVSPTTGDDHIILSNLPLLRRMKKLEDEGRFEFLFKLHPSTVMMLFDDTYFQLEKAGYAYVREHFRLVDAEHFSIFPLAESVRVHVTDLFSSMPALLTYLGDRVILAKDNPAVAGDHAIRPFLHLFDSPDEFEALLERVASLDHRNNGDFWRGHFFHARGDEDMQVADARGWLTRAAHAPAHSDEGSRARIKSELARFRRESEARHRSGEIDQDELDDVLSVLGEWTPGGTQ